jgi:hypothetical protein
LAPHDPTSVKLHLEKEKNINRKRIVCLSTLTNINCEMKSTAVYSALAAIVNQLKAGSNESMPSTVSWEFENQLNAAHIGSHDI